jgi:hypothetical protein
MSDKSEIILDTSTAPASESSATENTETTFGGFKSVEELVAAHEALKAQSSGSQAGAEGSSEATTEGKAPDKEIPAGTENTDDAAKHTVTNAGLDWDGLNTEYAKDGKLSDETYASLEAKGIPRDAVDTYIRGRQADADAYDSAVYGAAGGSAEYSSLVDWAKNALTQADKQAFNEAVTSGNAAKASLAVEALAARRSKGGRGTPPNNLLNGTGKSNGVQPYNSREEMSADFRSAKYKNDPAFRAQVVERMRVTHNK